MYEVIQSLLEDPAFKSEVNHRLKKFMPQEVILQEGKTHTDFYAIKLGTVRVSVTHDKEDDPHLHPGIADLGPGDIFGEFALYESTPASADVVAITETELIEIDITSFKNFLDRNPIIGYNCLMEMQKILVKRCLHSNKKIVNLLAWGIKSHKISKYL